MIDIPDCLPAADYSLECGKFIAARPRGSSRASTALRSDLTRLGRRDAPKGPVAVAATVACLKSLV